MTKPLLFFAFICFAISARFTYEYEITDAVFLVFGIVAFFVNRHYANIYGLLVIILCVRGLEALIWYALDINSAFVVYPVQIILDILVIVLIHYRWRIHVRLSKSLKVNEIVFTHADYHITQLHVLYAIVAFAALLEHTVRHPYAIGLPASWSVPDLLYVYDAIPYIRLGLEIIQYAIILFFSHRYLSSAKNITA